MCDQQNLCRRRCAGLAPFRGTFDPSEKRPFARVPRHFDAVDAYLNVMKHNVEAELAATVRQAQPIRLRGTIRQQSDENGQFNAWVEITDGIDACASLKKTLLRLQVRNAATWHIVRQHKQPEEANDSHQIRVQGLPAHLDEGQDIYFEAYGYIGDAVRTPCTSPVTALAPLIRLLCVVQMAQVEAIKTLKRDGHFLLRSVADPRVRVDGVYRDCAEGGDHLNQEQLLALRGLDRKSVV